MTLSASLPRLGAWLADIRGTVIARGGVSGAMAWLAGVALHGQRAVAA